MTAKVRKAIFPVGGLGTRFLPATKAMPKEMLPVVDKPLIEYAVEEAYESGIEQFIFVTGRGKVIIEDHFDHSFELFETLKNRDKNFQLDSLSTSKFEPGQISYVRQQQPLGLGHAVWCARHLIKDEPFAILLADDLILSKVPCLKQLVEAREENGGNILAAMTVPLEQTSRYGIIEAFNSRGNLHHIKALVEKPDPSDAPSNLAVVGRYILSSDIFSELDKVKPGVGGEIQLTDAITKLMVRDEIYGLTFEGRRFDCGDKLGFLEANIAFALERKDLGDFRTVISKYGG
ncbi:MAG: UTP--glucose-1-phosphate uridylyltransferase [Alphaproteobacteria bacterium]|jgi:UTP--glucose-1-phosphate uridylyltransferase|nr:UTP--glucose-1-phosphate uridylyltransferase [Alphaproteobacteria bacterium]PPR13186.1 MAG: UTP--glucose-1-phosphate uridylyltransferase [Alphaproteobacteria bacterium MarineAlpha12_Bin1]|tara:strand:- start:5917 stop:6786 length:870 start_codon:yes stop_codon:yes gene_type:complete